MKIYYSPLSSNSRKVLVTAAHLGLAPELVHVDLTKGEQRSPAFMVKNPNGKVPVLVDGDLALWESQAIMAYLAERTPGQTLYPSEPKARADVNRWMFWSANHWGPAIAILNFERMVKKVMGQGDPDPAQVARGEALFHGLAGILDAHLASRTWLAGEAVALADISVGCPLMGAATAKLPLEPYPNLRAWFSRVEALEAYRRASS